MNHAWTGLCLLLCAGQTLPLEAAPPGDAAIRPALSAVGDDEFADLDKAYHLALEDWDERYQQAKGMGARKQLEAQHPALEYWPRFEALASGGEGRALLWMSENLREKGLKVREAREERARLFALLAAEHVEAEWFGAVLESVAEERRSLAEGQEVATYRAAIERNPHREVQAQAIYQLSETLARDKGELSQNESNSLMEKLAQEYADTPHGEQAAGILFERRHLAVGKVAPDFEAETIDGHSFKLSDYRGKVVLLDFYGFW